MQFITAILTFACMWLLRNRVNALWIIIGNFRHWHFGGMLRRGCLIFLNLRVGTFPPFTFNYDN